jgi:hypothetical protein
MTGNHQPRGLMKRAALGTVIGVVVLTGLVAAAAQTQSSALPTAQQVVDKFIAAIGGRAALERITSRVASGTLEIPDAGVTGTLQISEKAPDKSLAVVEVPGLGTIKDGTDGTSSWEDAPPGGLRERTGSELAEAKRAATFNAELKWFTIYKTVTVTGREKVGTRDTIVVIATPPDGHPTTMYFDAENGLMLRQSLTRETSQGPIGVEVFFEDYREVDGIKQPFSVRQVTPQFTLSFKLTAIKHNVPLDDAIFRKPGIW